MALLQCLPISHRRKKRQSPQQPVWSHRTWPLVCLEPHCPSAACRTLPQPHWPPAGLCRHWVGPSEGQRLLLWTALSSYLKVSLPHLFHISVRYRPIGEAFPDHSTENHNPLHPFLSFFSTALLPPDIHFYFCLYCLSPRLDSKLHKDRGFGLIYSLLCSLCLEQCLACKKYEKQPEVKCLHYHSSVMGRVNWVVTVTSLHVEGRRKLCALGLLLAWEFLQLYLSFSPPLYPLHGLTRLLLPSRPSNRNFFNSLLLKPQAGFPSWRKWHAYFFPEQISFPLQ